MTHRFGFFDVDSRELHESGIGLAYRPRVLPIVPQLKKLYALAEAKGYPLVFTTCCSGRMPMGISAPECGRGLSAPTIVTDAIASGRGAEAPPTFHRASVDYLFIPLDAADVSWRAALRDHRRFYLAKRSCGSPSGNLACRAFDMFEHNANATQLIRELGVETWVVFGNGFDLCVGSAARGILKAELPLIVLEDVRVSSAGATRESELETLRALGERGARIMTLGAFLQLTGAS